MNYFDNLRQVFIIAEIGVNHNGDINLAKRLIDAAKKAGADAVKFQTYSAKLLASPLTPKVPYQKSTASCLETHLEMLERLELSKEQHIELMDYCGVRSIEFLSTPYDIESAHFLNSIGVKAFKTASADIVDLPLQHFIASTGKPAIVATGMATLGEIERVVQIYDTARNPNLILLHCVSSYPCSDLSLNLRSMNTLGDAFHVPYGYSDHSTGFLAAVISVSRGAKVVEKHLTLDKDLPGPDHKASSTPEEFTDLVANIRRAEIMLGSRQKIRQMEEGAMAIVSRKSIVLTHAMKAGSKLTIEDLGLQRPGDGIDPGFMAKVAGMVLRHDLQGGHQLKWVDLEGSAQ
jgi:N,N'-diacetyllegionaminate synthase